MQQDIARTAQEQLTKTLAAHFTHELGKGVSSVIAELARPGGYLDNPLVRILLPPPLVLVFDVAREMNAKPQSTLLVVLMNQAAEQAIPDAAPILQAALAQITPVDARRLLEGGKTAATDYLKAKTAGALNDALRSSVAATLAAGGAQRLYAELLDSRQAQQPFVIEAVPPATPEAAAHRLTQYVAGQAVDGVFEALGEREMLIRENLGSVLQGMDTAPAGGAPVMEVPVQ